MLIVILIRVISALIILRFPLLGAFLVILLDYRDMRILEFFQGGDLSNYQSLDKMLDLFYLTVELFVVFRWKNILAKNVAIFLFLHRLVGVVGFELTQNQALLVYFPNIFEYFFIVYLLQAKLLNKDIFLKPIPIIILVIALALVKVPHEYLLHVNKEQSWIDNKYIQMLIDPDFIEETAAKTIDQITP